MLLVVRMFLWVRKMEFFIMMMMLYRKFFVFCWFSCSRSCFEWLGSFMLGFMFSRFVYAYYLRVRIGMYVLVNRDFCVRVLG